MKKLTTLFAVLLLCFASCSSDDNDGDYVDVKDYPTAILGTWQNMVYDDLEKERYKFDGVSMTRSIIIINNNNLEIITGSSWYYEIKNDILIWKYDQSQSKIRITSDKLFLKYSGGEKTEVFEKVK